MMQLLLAVNLMHEKGIVHRDIKLENILISNIEDGAYEVKIADLGRASLLPENNHSMLHDICGTPNYMSPEMLNNSGYRERADIFSLGSVFFSLLT
jgi:serine/threonine protein kinase